jgi:hypothetical protein
MSLQSCGIMSLQSMWVTHVIHLMPDNGCNQLTVVSNSNHTQVPCCTLHTATAEPTSKLNVLAPAAAAVAARYYTQGPGTGITCPKGGSSPQLLHRAAGILHGKRLLSAPTPNFGSLEGYMHSTSSFQAMALLWLCMGYGESAWLCPQSFVYPAMFRIHK